MILEGSMREYRVEVNSHLLFVFLPVLHTYTIMMQSNNRSGSMKNGGALEMTNR
jgi:hypothetical protein